LKEGGATMDERITWLFRTVSGRKPAAKELSVLLRLVEEQRELISNDASAAEKVLKVGESKSDPALDKTELATATVLANALLNHDEFVMRR
jgi:hypothetical protein